MVKRLKNGIFSLLRRSESIFKTDMVYAAQGGFWLTFGHGIATLSSFLLAVAFANLLTQVDYGTYKYILSLAGLISSISLSGLSSAVARSVARGFEGSFLESFFLSLRWSILMALSALTLSIYYFVNGNNTLAIGMLFTGAFAPLIDSGEIYNAFLNGKKAFKIASLMRGLRSIVTAIFLFIGILITKNPVALVGIYFVSHAICVAFLFYISYKSFKPNKEVEKETVRLGKHVSVMNLLAEASDKIDSVLVYHYIGAAELAIYTFSLIIPNNILGLIKNVITLAIPKFVKRNVSDMKSQMLRKSLSLLYITVPITILYIICAPIIFKIFFPKYIESIIYSQVFAITIMMSGVLPMAILEARVAIKEKYILSILSSIIKIISLFIGVNFFGLMGLIIARIFSKLSGLIISYFLIKNMK
jgi:O-antigen/teichoic acid export membrane protein